MSKFFKIFLLIASLVIFICLIFFIIFTMQKQKKVTWGVNFSQMQSESLGLNWKENYLALLDDLGVKHIKLLAQWDFIEGTKGDFYFKDIDWQIQQAEDHNAKIVYVVGMKTGRWPECHLPSWANSLSKQQQQEELLAYIRQVVSRYKNSSAIVTWQAENEPLFNFGQCPWYDENFLKKEVALIKSIDPSRPVMVSDSGEQSLWLKAASIGDEVGVTLYRKVAFSLDDYFRLNLDYPIPAIVYWIKAGIIKKFYGKDVIGVELQAEPWVSDAFNRVPLQEQDKTMNVAQFQKNIQYARNTRIGKFYLWGAEWWYWLKEKQGRPQMWNEAKKLFSTN